MRLDGSVLSEKRQSLVQHFNRWGRERGWGRGRGRGREWEKDTEIERKKDRKIESEKVRKRERKERQRDVENRGCAVVKTMIFVLFYFIRKSHINVFNIFSFLL